MRHSGLILIGLCVLLVGGCNMGRRGELEQRKAEVEASDLPAREKAARIAEIETAMAATLEADRANAQAAQQGFSALPAPFGTIASGVLGIAAAGFGVRAKQNRRSAKKHEAAAQEHRGVAVEIVKAVESIIAAAPKADRCRLKKLWSPQAKKLVDAARSKQA